MTHEGFLSAHPLMPPRSPSGVADVGAAIHLSYPSTFLVDDEAEYDRLIQNPPAEPSR
jgi:hypothetical protein